MAPCSSWRKQIKALGLFTVLFSTLIVNFWQSSIDISKLQYQLSAISGITFISAGTSAMKTFPPMSEYGDDEDDDNNNEEPPQETSFVPIIWKNGNAIPIDAIKISGNNETRLLFKGHEWMWTYIEWHNEMRQRFPDNQLLENPDAPKVSIVYNCGKQGLNDRVNHHHQMVYAAHKKKEVLLFKWFGAASDLETFVAPNLVNWTVPHVRHTQFDPCTSSKVSHSILPTPAMVAGTNATITVGSSGSVASPIQVRSTDYYRSTDKKRVPKIKDTMYLAWNVFFQPSLLLQQELNKASKNLGLVAGNYDAAHCRVRHPAHFNQKTMNKEDMHGAKYVGKQRELAIRTAIRAIQCTKYIGSKKNKAEPDVPVYFYSDAEQLVHSAIRHDPPQDDLEKNLHALSIKAGVVGRFSEAKIRHIGDSQKGEIDSYLSTFVDLYIAAGARCIALGVGNFAYLASRISGTDCSITHEKIKKTLAAAWGMKDKLKKTENCPAELPSFVP